MLLVVLLVVLERVQAPVEVAIAVGVLPPLERVRTLADSRKMRLSWARLVGMWVRQDGYCGRC